ncbi:hypothetical protein NIES2135_41920 [Leptolyngbya boryana NIES-2135]|jgi:hypothetical protein|uniref:Uncharacterized protein n=2 Tax=Leptolyngbya boryana TaxID=1184 RepID=A0A1Z4JL57_LEPBY|nr:hypothetical protein NIES2135_41920 [Leptolyngbya boryana NIES-2135]
MLTAVHSDLTLFDCPLYGCDPPITFMTSILCYYINTSHSIQQIRLHTTQLALDRMVFPSEKIVFESLPEERLEIYTYTENGLQLFQSIACSQLEVLSRTKGRT